jgi:sugar lactone lactonase YvrE
VPYSVAVGADGTLYILDSANLRVMKVTNPGPHGTITRLAGAYVGPSGAPASTQLLRPRGVAAAPDGSIYIADGDKSAVRWVSADGKETDLVAGTGTRAFDGAPPAPDGSPATQARLGWPTGVAVGPDGTLYIADRSLHRVFKVTNPGPHGQIYTLAGTGFAGFAANGLQGGCCQGGANGQVGFATAAEGSPANQQRLYSPADVAVGPDGTVFIADTHNSMIRKVTTDGRIFTVAGTGVFGWNGDSANATAAALNQPMSVAVGPDGTVYFDDTLNACARKVTPQGALVTIAGTCTQGTGAPGSGLPLGDGGPATSASFGTTQFGSATAIGLAPTPLGGPEGIAVAADGTVYVGDTYNCRVRKVGTDGNISTVVGTGACGEAGDGGPANAAQLVGPRGLALDKNGNLLIGETDANKVRLVSPAS